MMWPEVGENAANCVPRVIDIAEVRRTLRQTHRIEKCRSSGFVPSLEMMLTQIILVGSFSVSGDSVSLGSVQLLDGTAQNALVALGIAQRHSFPKVGWGSAIDMTLLED